MSSMKVKFPIRMKLLSLMGALVAVATGCYLALALKLFKEDKASLVYEMNAASVRTLAAQTEAFLLKASDKVKLLIQGHRDEAWVRGVFEAEPDLVSFALYAFKGSSGDWVSIASVRNTGYLKLYGLSASEIDRVRRSTPIPFAAVLAKRSWASNATLSGGAPILTLAFPVEIVGAGRGISQHIAVADLRLDRLLKAIARPGISTTYLVDGDGNVVAHPDATWVSSRRSVSTLPIVREAIESKVAFQLMPFDWEGKRWLGAYSSVGVGGLSVISQTEEAQAFKAARKLIGKSILFALLFFTLSLIAARWLAQSLTRPLETLAGASERLSRWDLAEPVHVSARDEIGMLARAFNAMSEGLRNQKAQLDTSREELERKVKERTAALDLRNKQLAEAQDSLMRTTRLASLGELAGSAAHEVLNPLNNMNIRLDRLRTQLKGAELGDSKLLSEITSAWKSSYAKAGWSSLKEDLEKPAEGGARTLIEEDLENLSSIATDGSKRLEERAQDIEFLGREVGRISKIINGMRSLSRVGGERRPIDIHIPLEETSVTLVDLLEKRKISLVKDFSGEERERFAVIGDRDELVQVFSNLLRNSIHAVSDANRRAGSVRIQTRRTENRVEIRIIDNGIGIPAAHLPRLFEPNFTTKSVEEGTGLGLSISRRLIRAFGGDIEVEKTAEGEGTTFLVWLPATAEMD